MIKDNRVDNFCEVFGFEFDERSGLFLPKATEYQLPANSPVQFNYTGPTQTCSNKAPLPDLNQESLEAMMRKVAELRDKYSVPMVPMWRQKPEFYSPSMVEMVEAEELAQAVDAWLAASEAERP